MTRLTARFLGDFALLIGLVAIEVDCIFSDGNYWNSKLKKIERMPRVFLLVKGEGCSSVAFKIIVRFGDFSIHHEKVQSASRRDREHRA